MNNDSEYIPCDSCTMRTHLLFSHLSDKELQKVSHNKITESYKRGSIIYQEGTRMKGFYCVQSGITKIYKTGFDGKEQIIRLLSEFKTDQLIELNGRKIKILDMPGLKYIAGL